MAGHSVRNQETLYLFVASEPSVIAPDIVWKSDTFD
jgi:hypothetical protein